VLQNSFFLEEKAYKVANEIYLQKKIYILFLNKGNHFFFGFVTFR